MKYKLGGLDVCKFFMAICVVAIHTHPFENFDLYHFRALNSVYNVILSSAVPFFFLVNGFFLHYIPKEINKNVVRKMLFKILRLYITWTIIYFPITILDFVFNDSIFFKDVLLFCQRFIFIGQNQNSWILWYLLSEIYALIAIYFILFKLKLSLRTLFEISVILLILSYIHPYVLEIEFKNAFVDRAVSLLKFVLPEGRMLTSPFYITSGIIISKANAKITWIHGKITCVSLVAFWMIIFIQSIFVPFIDTSLITPFISFLIFMVALHAPIKTDACSMVLRKMSTVIYFTHMIVFTIYSLCCGHSFHLYGAEAFCITILGTMGFCLLYFCLLNKMKILKYII